MTTASHIHTNNSNRPYIILVSALTLVLPLACFVIEHLSANTPLAFAYFGKWFIFFAVGIRLALAGLRQTTKPAFTAKEIFHIKGEESYPVIRELGFANLCFGLVGTVSLFKPEWRIVSAFASGLYYGMAALLHLIKGPVGTNERFALWSDLLIFILLLAYFITYV